MSNMDKTKQAVAGSIAPLANIALGERAYSRLMGRRHDEPGLAILYGPSGFGKTKTAAWIKARHRAYSVHADDFWTRKTMLVAISKALGLSYADGKGDTGKFPDIYTMAEAIKEQLHTSGRLLIIDEFDICVRKNLVEAVRSLYEGSQAAILLIGEELLPKKLERWERFHGRILDWFPAEPMGLDDARTLADARYPDMIIADDLLKHLVEIGKGSVRRMVINLGSIQETALEEGWDNVDLSRWGDRKLQSNKAPRREK